ncbi:hypothetical protein V6R91_24395 [Microbacterium sp. CCNWLW41]
MDDRLVAHLRFEILKYLRRADALGLTVMQASPYPPGQTTVWNHPSISMCFELDAAEPPVLDRTFTKALASAASTPNGIVVSNGQFVPPEDAHAHTLTATSPPAT